MSDPSLEIRALRVRDLPEVLRLERACFADPWSSQSFRQEIRHGSSGGYSRVLVEGGKVLAYLIAWFVADEAHLANLAVAPEHRRRGLARKLLEDLLEESPRRDVARVWLEVRRGNLGAIRLYEAYGFRTVSIRRNYYAREGEDALVMVRAFEREEEKRVLVQQQEGGSAAADQEGDPGRDLGQVP